MELADVVEHSRSVEGDSLEASWALWIGFCSGHGNGLNGLPTSQWERLSHVKWSIRGSYSLMGACNLSLASHSGLVLPGWYKHGKLQR